MAFQIKTNALGFQEALQTMGRILTEWEDQNPELFRKLNELEAEWKGDSGNRSHDGSGCIYANSMKKAADLKQLRSDLYWAKKQIDLMDMTLVKNFANSLSAMTGDAAEVSHRPTQDSVYESE